MKGEPLESLKVWKSLKLRLDKEQGRRKELAGGPVSMSEMIQDLLDRAGTEQKPPSIEESLGGGQRQRLRCAADLLRYSGTDPDLKRAKTIVEATLDLWADARRRSSESQ